MPRAGSANRSISFFEAVAVAVVSRDEDLEEAGESSDGATSTSCSRSNSASSPTTSPIEESPLLVKHLTFRPCADSDSKGSPFLLMMLLLMTTVFREGAPTG